MFDDSCLSHYFKKTFEPWDKTLDEDQLQNFFFSFFIENDNLEKMAFLTASDASEKYICIITWENILAVAIWRSLANSEVRISV